jgi:hypothetical protein
VSPGCFQLAFVHILQQQDDHSSDAGAQAAGQMTAHKEVLPDVRAWVREVNNVPG